MLQSEGVVLEHPQIISIEYDDLHPERYESGVWIGVVAKRLDDRMKVIFVYEDGQTDIAWLSRH